MTGISIDRRKNFLGAVLFLALMLGGGAGPGLMTDAVLQILTLTAALYSLSKPADPGTQIRPFVTLLMIVALCAVLTQLVPLPYSLVQTLRPDVLQDRIGEELPASLGFLTLDADRTLSCFTYLFCLLIFARAVLRLNPTQVVGLLPFFLAGVACNAMIGLLQFSLSQEVSIEGLLPYTISAGTFANQNHFSTLLFMSIPFLVFLAIYKEQALLGFLSLIGLLLVLFAAGSRAGVLIGIVIGIFSLLFLSSKSRALNLFTFAALVALAVFALGAWSQLETQELDPKFGRGEFARTTLEGIKDNWIAGVGYGTFPRSYGLYERNSMIQSVYVNHAHNEYLELAFEGGVLAMVTLAAFLTYLLAQVPSIATEPFKKAAFLSVFFVLVHSVVDYPLRTMGIALSFSYLVAVVFYGGAWKRPGRQTVEPEILVERASRTSEATITAYQARLSESASRGQGG